MTAIDGAVTGSVKSWLRFEGAAALVLAVMLFSRTDAPWTLFAALFLVPDVSFAAYLAGPRTGAIVYNVMHSYATPLLLAIAMMGTGSSPAIALIWAAHIGFDRAVGYGLKYPTAFADTHLGRIGSSGSRKQSVER